MRRAAIWSIIERENRNERVTDTVQNLFQEMFEVYRAV